MSRAGITSLRSKYMTSGDHHGRLITSWRESAYRIGRLGLLQQTVFRKYDNGTYHMTLHPGVI